VEKPSSPQAPAEKLSLPPAGTRRPLPMQPNARRPDGPQEESIRQARPPRPLPLTPRTLPSFRRGRGNSTYRPSAQPSIPLEQTTPTTPSGSTQSSEP
jgi:hypothetical protein